MKHCIGILYCWLACIATYAGTPLRIVVVSDIHYLSESLMDNGSEIQKYERNSAKNIRDIPAILHEVQSDLENHPPDVLLIAGDLTKDGELQSHLDIKQRLDKLAALGTRIFVIPGNHDISYPHAVGYDGDKTFGVPNISPDAFAGIYRNYGFAQAFSRDTASLSYAVPLDSSTWLLAIDSNRYKEYTNNSISSGRILPETEKWIIGLLDEAKQKNITVFGMMHHGLVEHFMYQDLFYPDYIVSDWKRLAAIFADRGMKVVFTGHFHANDIAAYDSADGNKIYDIETGSLSSFPFPYRKLVWDGKVLDVHTKNIRSIPGKPDLAMQDSIVKLKFAVESGKRQIRRRIADLPDSTVDVLAQVIGRIYIMHVRGDEKIDDDMRRIVARFSSLMGGGMEIDFSEFQLDSPPADNDVRLEIQQKSSVE
jgi:DNA repair exonuclease SbcCD nuclease subunit